MCINKVIGKFYFLFLSSTGFLDEILRLICNLQQFYVSCLLHFKTMGTFLEKKVYFSEPLLFCCFGGTWMINQERLNESF